MPSFPLLAGPALIETLISSLFHNPHYPFTPKPSSTSLLHSALPPSLPLCRVHALAITTLGLLSLSRHHPGALTQQPGCCSHPAPAGAGNPALSAVGWASRWSAGSSQGRCSHHALEEEHTCRLRMLFLGWLVPSPSLPRGRKGCMATQEEQGRMVPPATPSHTVPSAHAGTGFIAPTPWCQEPFASFSQRAKGRETANWRRATLLHAWVFPAPPGPAPAASKAGRGLYPGSGRCNKDTNSRGARNGFSFIC